MTAALPAYPVGQTPLLARRRHETRDGCPDVRLNRSVVVTQDEAAGCPVPLVPENLVKVLPHAQPLAVLRPPDIARSLRRRSHPQGAARPTRLEPSGRISRFLDTRCQSFLVHSKLHEQQYSANCARDGPCPIQPYCLRPKAPPPSQRPGATFSSIRVKHVRRNQLSPVSLSSVIHCYWTWSSSS